MEKRKFLVWKTDNMKRSGILTAEGVRIKTIVTFLEDYQSEVKDFGGDIQGARCVFTANNMRSKCCFNQRLRQDPPILQEYDAIDQKDNVWHLTNHKALQGFMSQATL